MADAFQRKALYEYGKISNLVLEADRDVRRREEDGAGEVESLAGKLGPIRMGDKIMRDTRQELNDRLEKLKSKRKHNEDTDEVSARKKKESSLIFASKSVLTETNDLDSINYHPKTRESRLSYEEILTNIQHSIGDQPQDVIKGAADEVLACLKDDSLRDPEKIRQITKILPHLTSERLNKIINLSKSIKDFNQGMNNTTEIPAKLDESIGVAVVFEDDDIEKGDNDEENDSSDEENEGGVEAFGSGMLKGEEDHGDFDNADVGKLSAHDIDSHWLQRKLAKYYFDANVTSKLSEDILMALQSVDERECENKLVMLLDFDKFKFIKLLLNNRFKIYYCTRLRQAQTKTERELIEAEMSLDLINQGAAILAEINEKVSAESWTQDRMGQIANKAKREARALALGSGKVLSSDEDINNFDTTVNATVAMPSLENLVDLDSLKFPQGGHMMANSRCELPEKSWRAQKKGYEEVHVPAVRPVISSDEVLVSVSDLPAWTQPAFGQINKLNRIQSRMVSAALYGTENLLLCAPTGAGKTNVALMCILNQIGQYMREDKSFDLDSFKVIYIAPMKALVQECVLSFSKKLSPFGIKVMELSGDQNLTRQQIQSTQVIITTPEKWDIVTRKSGDRTYTQLVRLVIFDEIHLLHDDRGPVIESLVARIIRQVESTQEMVRLVGLSATLPNFEDVATFLRVNPKKGLYYFDSSFRPVPLQQQFIGITEKKA